MGLQNVARPVGVKTHAGFDNRMSWQEVAYIVVAVVMIVQGGVSFILNAPWAGGSTFGAVVGIFGAIEAGLGAGLLAQQTWAQFLTKWYCILDIVGYLGSILMSTIALGAKSDALHVVGILLLLWSVFHIALDGFMLYLIKEVGDVD
jgi:hypothetical protein